MFFEPSTSIHSLATLKEGYCFRVANGVSGAEDLGCGSVCIYVHAFLECSAATIYTSSG